MPKFFYLGIFLFLLIGLGAGKAEAGTADHAVVNEVGIDGVVGSGGADDDWVELHNPTASAVDLTGWSIQKTAGSGSSLAKALLSGSIPAQGYFLIVRGGATTDPNLLAKADLVTSNSFSLAQNNIVYLVNNIDNIIDATDPDIVDFVGFGSASFYEGTAAAPSIPDAKSIARIPAGEDTDENSVDFQVQDTPTPTNSFASGSGYDVSGTVVLTITPDQIPEQNIISTGADIVFQVNAAGAAQIKFGLDASYANITAPVTVADNEIKTISLSGLTCATTYHYAIYAENTGATESDQTVDKIFTTLPCGIKVDSLVMTKASAKANNQYNDGWEWKFNLTVWDLAETFLKMKFNQWSGAGVLAAGGNMQYSVDSGVNWTDIIADGAYPVTGVDISSIDIGAGAGRQVEVLVRMKVPVGTSAGFYNSNYGILTE